MASGKDYLDYILEQLSGLEGIRWRSMMGEYLLSYQGKLVGGIYDDRLLLKPTDAVCRMIPDAPRELPYEGGREMLLVEEVDDAEFLCALLAEAAKGAPPPRRRR